MSSSVSLSCSGSKSLSAPTRVWCGGGEDGGPHVTTELVASEALHLLAPVLCFIFSVGSMAPSPLPPIIIGLGPICMHVHGIRVWSWHLDSQDLSQQLGRHLRLGSSCGGLLWGFFKYTPDVLDRCVVLMILVGSLHPALEVHRSDHLVNVVHHLEWKFGRIE